MEVKEIKGRIESPKVELQAREVEIIITLINRAQITGAEAESVAAIKSKLGTLLEVIAASNGV